MPSDLTASLTLDQLPQMEEHGLKVIIVDNCSTHKSVALRDIIEDQDMPPLPRLQLHSLSHCFHI